jgi:hypothetical protein
MTVAPAMDHGWIMMATESAAGGKTRAEQNTAKVERERPSIRAGRPTFRARRRCTLGPRWPRRGSLRDGGRLCALARPRSIRFGMTAAPACCPRPCVPQALVLRHYQESPRSADRLELVQSAGSCADARRASPASSQRRLPAGHSICRGSCESSGRRHRMAPLHLHRGRPPGPSSAIAYCYS